MDQTCADCEATLDHCHGTLIVHQENVRECTEDGCFVLDSARHDFVVDCVGLTDCDCTRAVVAHYRQIA